MAPTDSAKSRWWHEPAARASLAAIPVVAVNSTAWIGQYAYIHTHVPWIIPGQVMISLTIESVAVYLAWHAHLAQMANDSAARLKMGAYSFALVVGLMNYSHYASRWHPTVMAVLMFCMSALSPWLWGVHTRRASRDGLMARGLVEEHAVRLGATRVTWHPVRSVRVLSWSAWHGINDPKRAIGHFASRYGTADTPALVPPARTRRAIEVPAAVPEPEPSAMPSVPAVKPPSGGTPAIGGTVLPGTQVNGVTPGTLVNGAAVVSAQAVLAAEAALSGGKPSREKITEAELTLAATPLDDLPSIRAVARDLLGDENQRRLAKKLLDARKEAGTSLASAPADERAPVNSLRPVRPGTPVMIAAPDGFRPGGTAVNG